MADDNYPNTELDAELEYVNLRRVTRRAGFPDATTTHYLKHRPDRLPPTVRIGRQRMVHRDAALKWLREQTKANA